MRLRSLRVQDRRSLLAALMPALWLLMSAAGCSETPTPDSSRPPGARDVDSKRSATGAAPVSSSVAADAQRAIGPLGTPYYESSPAQGRPPEGQLSPGTVVELLETAGSYSLVKWDAKRAWVATDALREVEPQPRKVHKIPMH